MKHAPNLEDARRDKEREERYETWRDRFDGDTVAEKWTREDNRAEGFAATPEWRAA